MKRRILIIGAIVCVVLFVFSCSTNIHTGRTSFNLISEQEEIELGEAAFEEVKSQSTISTNPVYNARLGIVATRLIAAVGDEMPQAQWEFVVIEEDTINAFALPGGKIAVYTGLMGIINDDELAYVLGHEIAHVTLRHGTERMSEALALQTVASLLTGDQSENTSTLFLAAFGLGSQIGVLLPHSRRNELEADKVGLLYSSRAGYNPEGALSMLNTFQQMSQGSVIPEFLSTHPVEESRIAQIQELMPEMKAVYQQNKK